MLFPVSPSLMFALGRLPLPISRLAVPRPLSPHHHAASRSSTLFVPPPAERHPYPSLLGLLILFHLTVSSAAARPQRQVAQPARESPLAVCVRASAYPPPPPLRPFGPPARRAPARADPRSHRQACTLAVSLDAKAQTRRDPPSALSPCRPRARALRARACASGRPLAPDSNRHPARRRARRAPGSTAMPRADRRRSGSHKRKEAAESEAPEAAEEAPKPSRLVVAAAAPEALGDARWALACMSMSPPEVGSSIVASTGAAGGGTPSRKAAPTSAGSGLGSGLVCRRRAGCVAMAGSRLASVTMQLTVVCRLLLRGRWQRRDRAEWSEADSVGVEL